MLLIMKFFLSVHCSAVLVVILIMTNTVTAAEDNSTTISAETSTTNGETNTNMSTSAQAKEELKNEHKEHTAATSSTESKENKDSTSATSTAEKQKNDKAETATPATSKLAKVGNLAFPVSQQPTPLISFGQNLLAAEQAEFKIEAKKIQWKNGYLIEWANSLTYGFSDICSLFIHYPTIVRQREGAHHTSGVEDVIIQGEYAPYTKEYVTRYDQLTIVGNVTIPTGKVNRQIPTGVGANSFFIGFTYSRMSINWFDFTSYGVILNGSSHCTRYGNQFLYQYGIGRRIWNSKDWLFDWMIEINGQYAQRDRIKGAIDCNSGGNIIYLVPSLFLSYKKHFVAQVGAGGVVFQQLNGKQNRYSYVLDLQISWSF